MARLIHKSKSDIGQSPYELKFKGKKRSDHVMLRVIDFDPNELLEIQLNEFREIQQFLDTDTVTWLNVDGLHDSSLIQQIGEVFQLDHMMLSDVLDTEQRPKVQEYDDYIYISMKMMHYDEVKNELHKEKLSLVLAKNLLISFQERHGDVFDPIRERIRKHKRKIRNSGTDYLAFALIDTVIDNYIYIISTIGEKIEKLEDELIDNPTRDMLEHINDFKREINYLRRLIHPTKEMVNGLVKLDTELIDQEATGAHWRELQDNINLAIETADGYREILSDMMNIYHTTVSTKLNDIMKFLTIFSVIFIPLTFIAGIYGTNFDNLPELHYEYAYFIMLGAMVVITIGMIFYFRSRNWF